MRLGSGWVTQQAHIDIRSESAPNIVGTLLFLGSSEELSQNAFFDILMAEDRGCEGTHQILHNILFARHPHKILFLLVSEDSLRILDPSLAFLHNRGGDEIDVSVEDCPHLIVFALDFGGEGTVDADQLHPISWPESIHIIIISNDCQGCWCLSFHD